jgi:hypothetical protein
MNTGEKIVGAYLRLNGFLVLPHFTILDGEHHTHVDFVGLRPRGGAEVVNGDELPRDDMLTSALAAACAEPDRRASNLWLGLVAEVKTTEKPAAIAKASIEYARRFLGDVDKVLGISFSGAISDLAHVDATIHFPLRRCVDWALQRIRLMEASRFRLSKTGSWTWSEAFLADLLVLERLGHFAVPTCPSSVPEDIETGVQPRCPVASPDA